MSFPAPHPPRTVPYSTTFVSLALFGQSVSFSGRENQRLPFIIRTSSNQVFLTTQPALCIFMLPLASTYSQSHTTSPPLQRQCDRPYTSFVTLKGKAASVPICLLNAEKLQLFLASSLPSSSRSKWGRARCASTSVANWQVISIHCGGEGEFLVF